MIKNLKVKKFLYNLTKIPSVSVCEKEINDFLSNVIIRETTDVSITFSEPYIFVSVVYTEKPVKVIKKRKIKVKKNKRK